MVRAAAMILAVCACVGPTGCGRAEVVGGPTAAVMDPKGTVVLVDLEHGEVIDTVRMRSWTADICAEEEQGVFVTAQSGGVGSDADDAVGIIGVRKDRDVRYVTLPYPNPLGVESAARGRVLVDHGWMQRDGMSACIVDTGRAQVVRRGHIPDNNGAVVAAGGFGWSPGVDVKTDRPSLRRVDLGTLESAEATGDGGMAFVECETPEGMAGWIRTEAGETLLARFDARTGSVIATGNTSFEGGPGDLTYCDGLLVATDFSGERIDAPVGRLLVFDAVSLRYVRAILLDGACDVASWRQRVVAADFRHGTLNIVDPVLGTVERRVRLPRMAALPLRIAVLD